MRLVEALEEVRRQRILTDDELVEVWNAASSLPKLPRAIIRLLILTGQRAMEIAGMEPRELGHNSGLLTIPASRMKAKLDHEVPLPTQALDIIRDVGRIAGSPWIFPNTRGTRPIGSFRHIKRLLDRAVAQAREQVRMEPMPAWRLHDLRRTMRSGLSRLKVEYEVAERAIAHVPGTNVSKTYNVWDFREPKAEALQAWASYVERVVNPQSNIIDLRDRAAMVGPR